MKNLYLAFYIKKDKVNENGESPIFVKINVNGSQTTMVTPHRISAKRWSETKQLKLARRPEDIFVRTAILDMKVQFTDILKKFNENALYPTAEQLKAAFSNKDLAPTSENKKLLEVYDWHNNRYEMKVKLGERTKISLQKHKNFRAKISEFIKKHFNASDILLSHLNFQFIDAFDMFLRTERGLQHNSTVKVVQGVRKVINDAIKYGWLHKDPFALYNEREIEVEAVYLSQNELEAIENKLLPIKRLDVVRDIFVFTCYTGYAPCDVQSLTVNNIQIHSDGQPWIFINRQKTKIRSNVLLLPKALEIIAKYANDDCRKTKGYLFPRRSNQKINAGRQYS